MKGRLWEARIIGSLGEVNADVAIEDLYHSTALVAPRLPVAQQVRRHERVGLQAAE